MVESLRDTFAAAAAGGDGIDIPDQARLVAACDEAAALLPGHALDSHAFVKMLGERGSIPTGDGFAEVALSWGCVCGDARAMARFERDYIQTIPRAVAHMRLAPDRVDEVMQAVRDKLLVSAEVERAPKLLAYAGQGKLLGLIGVVAVRAALSMLRTEKRDPLRGVDSIDRVAGADEANAGDAAAFEFVKRDYRDAFKQGFEDGVSALDTRGRNLLRLHLLRGVTLEQLAKMYGVHRATVVRWLAKARQDVFDATKQRLATDLKVSAAELEELYGWMESRLDLSVSRVLRTLPGSE